MESNEEVITEGYEEKRYFHPKSIADPNSILVRHKKFLRQLEETKTRERDDKNAYEEEKQTKMKSFKENAAK